MTANLLYAAPGGRPVSPEDPAEPGPADLHEDLVRAYRDHAAEIRRLCWFLLGNEADADDAVQETFARLCRSAATLRDRSALGGWLHTVALNEARRVASRRRQAPLPADLARGEPGTSASSAIVRDESRSTLAQALAGLGERERLLFYMRFVEEHSYARIAQETEMTEGAAKMAVHRALNQLRERLTQKEG